MKRASGANPTETLSLFGAHSPVFFLVFRASLRRSDKQRDGIRAVETLSTPERPSPLALRLCAAARRVFTALDAGVDSARALGNMRCNNLVRAESPLDSHAAKFFRGRGAVGEESVAFDARSMLFLAWVSGTCCGSLPAPRKAALRSAPSAMDLDRVNVGRNFLRTTDTQRASTDTLGFNELSSPPPLGHD